MTSTSESVKAQYEAYPYPNRDPKDEQQRLIRGSPSELDEIEHYLFKGYLNPEEPFRALFAGGGTGDGLVMLAQQLQERGFTKAELVYLDLSLSARQIAEARIHARKLKNVHFMTASLFELEAFKLGKFDYIDCCGVLHHLDQPESGLTALKKHLKASGGMGLMVYAPYGRTGVYPLQDALKRLTQPDLQDKIAFTRELLQTLPDQHWFKRNPYLGDHRRSDAELVDLLLHSCDRAFTVAEFLDLIEQANLGLVSWIEDARYDPASYSDSPRLHKALDNLDARERAIIAEQLGSQMKVHIAYVSHKAKLEEIRKANSAFQKTSIPRLHRIDGKKLSVSLERESFLKGQLGGIPVRFPLPSLASRLIAAFDGHKNLEMITAALKRETPTISGSAINQQLVELLSRLISLNLATLYRPPT